MSHMNNKIGENVLKLNIFHKFVEMFLILSLTCYESVIYKLGNDGWAGDHLKGQKTELAVSSPH